MVVLNDTCVAPGPHGRLCINPSSAGPDSCGPSARIILPYVNRGLEAAHPAQLVSDLISEFELPLNRDSIQITWSYNSNLKRLFYKPSSIFRDSELSFEQVSEICRNHTCSCSAVPDCFKSSHASGHLHTTSSDWIRSFLHLPLVADELDKGLNHIPLAPVSLDDVAYVNLSCAEKVCELLCYPPFPVETLKAFASEWTHRRSEAILSYHDPGSIDTSNPRFISDVRSVTDIAFVCSTDKAANHPFYFCRHYALLLSLQQIHDSAAYSVVPENPFASLHSDLLGLLSEFAGYSDTTTNNMFVTYTAQRL